MRCTTTTADHLSEVVKGMEKAALNLKFVLTDKFGIYLVYFQTRVGISTIRRVGNTARMRKTGYGWWAANPSDWERFQTINSERCDES